MPRPMDADVFRLTAGSQIQLNVNVHADEATEVKLLGRKRDEYVERTVRAVVYYDDESQYAGSVRVELPSGELVGWITKADQRLANKLLDGVSKARKRRDRKRPLVLEVSMRVEGERGDDFADLDEVVVRVKDPVEAKPV